MNHIETSKPDEKKWTVTIVAVTVFAAIIATFALVFVLYQRQSVSTASEKSLVFFDRSQPLSQHPFIDLSSIELTPSDHALLSSFKRPTELTCHLPPTTPSDRRRDKNLLRVVNFNPKWLFQFGGGESRSVPGMAAPGRYRQLFDFVLYPEDTRDVAAAFEKGSRDPCPARCRHHPFGRGRVLLHPRVAPSAPSP